MKRLPLSTLCGLSVGMASALARAADPSAEALDALRNFVMVDCEVPAESGTALAGVLGHGSALEPELRRLVLEGPSIEWLDESAQALEDEWQRRQAFLASNPNLGLDPEARLAVLSTSHEAFVGQGLTRFESIVREKAIVALAALATPSARQALRELSTQVDPPTRAVILAALKRDRVPASRQEPQRGAAGGRPPS